MYILEFSVQPSGFLSYTLPNPVAVDYILKIVCDVKEII